MLTEDSFDYGPPKDERDALIANLRLQLADYQIAASAEAHEVNKRGEQIAELRQQLAAATETWTDEAGSTWVPPTAWAYAQICRTAAEQRARAERAEAERERLKEYEQRSFEQGQIIAGLILERDLAVKLMGKMRAQQGKFGGVEIGLLAEIDALLAASAGPQS